MLLTGTNIHESQQALKLARRYPHCWSTAGVHPHDSSQWSSASEDAIIALANQPEVVAIGECGLDFNRNFLRRRSRSVPFRRSYKLPPNYRCQSLCTAGTRMSDFWHCLILAG